MAKITGEQELARVRPSSFITKGPSRIFIHEAFSSNQSSLFKSVQDVVQFPQEVDWFNEAFKMVRLMGMVTSVELFSSADKDESLDINNIIFNNQQDDMVAISIDDGTASIRVYIHQQEVDEDQLQTLLNRPDAGLIVDCLGYLIACSPHDKNSTNRRQDGNDFAFTSADIDSGSSEVAVCLLARSIACTNDLNAEQLRNLEILQHRRNKEKQFVTDIFYDNIFMAGSPTLTTGTFSAVVSSSSTSYSIIVNSHHVMQLIQSAASGGGVTEHDLALVLGIIDKSFELQRKSIATPTNKSIRISTTKMEMGLQGLRNALEELQTTGMIYMGSGNVYLPL